MVLQYFYSLYKYCCFRFPEHRTRSDPPKGAPPLGGDELRDEDMKIILESFKNKIDRLKRSRIKCC